MLVTIQNMARKNHEQHLPREDRIPDFAPPRFRSGERG
jgi:hypothetical protein